MSEQRKRINIGTVIIIIAAFSICLLVVYGLSIYPFGNSVTPVNGDPSVTTKQQTFYLGDLIYNKYPDMYYFHGYSFSGVSRFLLIGRGHYESITNMQVQIPSVKEIQGEFRISGRIFTIIDRGHDYITLEWEK